MALKADLASKKWMQEIHKFYSEKVNDDNIVAYVQETLQRLVDKFPQTNINGKDNIWILKPGGKSRGRGITVHRSYESIMHALRDSTGKQVV